MERVIISHNMTLLTAVSSQFTAKSSTHQYHHPLQPGLLLADVGAETAVGQLM